MKEKKSLISFFYFLSLAAVVVSCDDLMFGL